MANTTNFGWETPDDTDLVKDGAAAMRTLGNSIDASFVDLKGGTTGQVLAKASNTDLDFTWSSVDPLTILDAKGDLITATAADTPARLAVGTNGQYLQADSTTATGLKWASISAGAYTSITSTTISSNAATVTISSIPSTYKHLLLICRGVRVSANGDMRFRMNGITSADYNFDGSFFGVSTGDTGTQSIPMSKYAATTDYLNNANQARSFFAVMIYDYANTSTNKFVSIQGSYLSNAVGNWATSNFSGALNFGTPAAISSVSIYNDSSFFNAGTLELYGVN